MKNKLSLLLVSFFLFSCAENKQVTEQQTTFCNPMNLDYGWGCFQKREKKARTAADPVIVLFKDKYYLFTTMDIGGYRVSDDLITWKDVYFNPEIHASALDIDHYVAPAVAADDNYVYFINFTRDRSKKKVDVIRSADPENGKNAVRYGVWPILVCLLMTGAFISIMGWVQSNLPLSLK